MVGKVSLLLAAGAVLLGGAVLVQDPKPPANAMPAVKIGFVDMFRVQEQSVRQKEAFGKLQEQTMQDKQGLEKRVADLQKKQREELPLFEEGSPEFEKLRVEILTEEQHIKFLQRSLIERLKRENARLLDQFYKELQQIVGVYAREHGFTTILLDRPLQKIRSEESILMLNNQWVIYRDPRLDLTDRIIALMDRR
jgi:Skp family chaperone for outer membrane proteins